MLEKEVIDIVPDRIFQASNSPILTEMLKHFSSYEYGEVFDLYEANKDITQEEVLGELHLGMVQICFFVAPGKLPEHLKAARKMLPEGSRFPMIGSRFQAEYPWIYCFVNPEGNPARDIQQFRKSFPLLQQLCGERSLDIAVVYEADLAYLQGDVEKSYSLCKTVYEAMVKNSQYYIAMVAGFALIRCYVYQGNREGVQEVLGQLGRYAKTLRGGFYKSLYSRIRGWVNYTTGWLGEMPRFLQAPNGVESVVLDDRVYYYIEMGQRELTTAEASLSVCGKRVAPGGIPLKELHNTIFHAVVLFKHGKKDTAVKLLYQAYEWTSKLKLIMPFVEYGKQIVPLLQFALSQEGEEQISRRWSDYITQKATQYEESLKVVRGESCTPGEDYLFNEREIALLRYLVEGKSAPQIAQSIGLNIKHTRAMLHDLYQKTGTDNRAQIVSKVLEGEIVFPEGEALQG